MNNMGCRTKRRQRTAAVSQENGAVREQGRKIIINSVGLCWRDPLWGVNIPIDSAMK